MLFFGAIFLKIIFSLDLTITFRYSIVEPKYIHAESEVVQRTEFPIGSGGENRDGKENGERGTSLLRLLPSLGSPQTRFKPEILPLRGLPGSKSPWKHREVSQDSVPGYTLGS